MPPQATQGMPVMWRNGQMHGEAVLVPRRHPQHHERGSGQRDAEPEPFVVDFPGREGPAFNDHQLPYGGRPCAPRR